MRPMVFSLRHLALMAARKLAEDPDARAKAADLARRAGREAGRIARSEDRAYAAGQAARRLRDGIGRHLRREDD